VKGEFEFTDVDDYPTRVGLSKRDGYTFGVGGHWRPLFGQLAGDIRLGTAIWRDPEIHSANSNRIGSRSLASWKLVLDQKKKMLWLLEDNLMMTTTWTGRMEPDGRSSVYGFVSIAEGDGFIVQEVDFGSRVTAIHGKVLMRVHLAKALKWMLLDFGCTSFGVPRSMRSQWHSRIHFQ
jgi:hypothetical protein